MYIHEQGALLKPSGNSGRTCNRRAFPERTVRMTGSVSHCRGGVGGETETMPAPRPTISSSWADNICSSTAWY